MRCKRIQAHQFAELQEVRHASRILERLVEFLAASEDGDILPEFFAQFRDSARSRASSPASFRAMPHSSQTSLPSSRWNDATVRLPLISMKRLRLLRDAASASVNRRMALVDLLELRVGEVVADGVGKHEVSVGQTLHQRAGAQAVRAVIGEVRFADGV